MTDFHCETQPLFAQRVLGGGQWRLARAVFSIVVCGILIATPNSFAQESAALPPEVWEMQNSGVDASLRGLSLVNAKVAWACGTGGTVIRTIDAGKTWQNVSLADHSDLDFRDLHAFDENTCVIINAGTPGNVFRTTDAGKTWTNSYRNESATIFFDAISFFDNQHGIAFSDPQEGRYYFIESADGGTSWRPWEAKRCPEAHPGEAAFAASGTSLAVMGEDQIWLATGGEHGPDQEPAARVFASTDRGLTWEVATTPLASTQSAGIFSIAFANADHGVVVGGDYLKPDGNTSNAAFTDDAGKHWRVPEGNSPNGYRSSVAVLNVDFAAHFVAVGPTGTDVSSDWGRSWRVLDDSPFHAIAFTADGSAGWAVGGDGRVGRWIGNAALKSQR
jgi:photosystem II stability/assembly factor-like uncharacterized protein